VPRPRIILLYADTGGGHRATAQAVDMAIHQLYGDAYQTEAVNAIHALPYPYDQAEKVYPVAISQSRLGYAFFWNATNNRGSTAASRFFIETAGYNRTHHFLKQHPADLYVSCHPMLNQAIPEALHQISPGTPVVGIVSDLCTVHALAWSPKVTHYTVPTEVARQAALQNGILPNRITVTGQPVLPNFAARVHEGRTKRVQMGYAPGRSVVLVMGGGDGMGHLVETVQALAQSDLPIQIVAVCGRNEQARATIHAMPSHTPIRALGFCDNIPELMGSADVLVTKAGPGSICEGFIAGLPLILYDAVPGQEEGNITWVTQSGAGYWCPTPVQVVEQVSQWLTHPDQMRQNSRSALAQARPDAALNIARVIADTFAQRTSQLPISEDRFDWRDLLEKM